MFVNLHYMICVYVAVHAENVAGTAMSIDSEDHLPPSPAPGNAPTPTVPATPTTPMLKLQTPQGRLK